MGILRLAARSLAHIVAPRVCRVCGQTLTEQEHILCLGCMMSLPRTGVHSQPFNEIHRRLGHHCKVDRAAGWFYYTKESDYARLLIDAKYSDLPALAYDMGRQCAAELIGDGFFQDIELLVPMPMHWFKRLRRGYNQAEEIARGVGSATSIAVDNALAATRSHGVQSRRGRSARYRKIANTMDVRHPSEVAGRHILLVDDIITTGASVSEAIRALQKAAPASISVLCLGLTRMYQ